jgi:hypothetical protein
MSQGLFAFGLSIKRKVSERRTIMETMKWEYISFFTPVDGGRHKVASRFPPGNRMNKGGGWNAKH